MYLSQIQIDIRHPGIRRALRNCNELHRDLMSAFPHTQTDDAARKTENMLFRLIERRDGFYLLMSSESVPDAERLFRRGYILRSDAVKDVSVLETVFRQGMLLRFEILVSPSKKTGGEQKNSRRIFLKEAEERAQWMERQGKKYGFHIRVLEENAVRVSLDGIKNEMRIHYDAVNMTGVLEITDARLFWQAYRQGIGPGKAYGLGMLTVAPVR